MPFLKAWIHCAMLHALLHAMAKLHHISTPEIVACSRVHNVAAVEFCPTSVTLHATNFFVYPLSATFHAKV